MVQFGVVLAEQRWCCRGPQRRPVDEHAVAADPQLAGGSVREGQVGEEAPVNQLVELDRLGHGQDPGGRDAGLGQQLLPLRRGPFPQCGVELVVERGTVPLARVAPGKPLVAGQVLAAHQAA
jgi:hypothetical protein